MLEVGTSKSYTMATAVCHLASLLRTCRPHHNQTDGFIWCKYDLWYLYTWSVWNNAPSCSECETLLLTEIETDRGVWERSAEKNIVSKWEEVTDEWRKIHSERVNDLHYSPNDVRCWDGWHVTHMAEIKNVCNIKASSLCRRIEKWGVNAQTGLKRLRSGSGGQLS
jgi:hypothetical protein